jgi:hypothetical protein
VDHETDYLAMPIVPDDAIQRVSGALMGQTKASVQGAASSSRVTKLPGRRTDQIRGVELFSL